MAAGPGPAPMSGVIRGDAMMGVSGTKAGDGRGARTLVPVAVVVLTCSVGSEASVGSGGGASAGVLLEDHGMRRSSNERGLCEVGV